MLLVSNYHYIRKEFNSPFPSIFGQTPTEFSARLKAQQKLGKFIHLLDLLRNTNPIEKNYFCDISFLSEQPLPKEFIVRSLYSDHGRIGSII